MQFVLVSLNSLKGICVTYCNKFLAILSDHLSLNKFGTNNNASWMTQDEEEDEDENEEEDEDEDEEEDSLLTSQEPFRMITKLILAEFTD